MSMIKISEYSESEVVLSNGETIKGSGILADNGKFFSVKLEKSIEDFLNDEKNYTFLEMFNKKKYFWLVVEKIL